jgi:hypothetical protein
LTTIHTSTRFFEAKSPPEVVRRAVGQEDLFDQSTEIVEND